jgi:hypothetical protein
MAWRTRAKSTFVVLTAVGLLSGCSNDEPSVSDRNIIVHTLLRHQAATCDLQTLFIRAGKFGTGQEQYFENWFDKSVLVDRRFERTSDATDETTRRGSFSYSDRGNLFHVTWSQSDPPDMPFNSSLSINGCVYVPKSINIINESFDDGRGTARVTFTEEFRLSLLGQMMNDKGVLRKYDPIGPPQGFEYIALLNKSQLGQWRIAGVGVN